MFVFAVSLPVWTAVFKVVTCVINVQIMVAGYNSTAHLNTLTYMRPFLDVAVEDANARYNGSVHLTIDYVTESGVRNCIELMDNIERMTSQWYYTKAKRGDVVSVLSSTG